jgi:hypothetical protein
LISRRLVSPGEPVSPGRLSRGNDERPETIRANP